MYSAMPSTCASFPCRRRITSVADAARVARGFRLISIRPLLSVALAPSTPMNDVRLATAGSSSTTLASACCRSAIAANEIVCGASEMPWIAPVSWIGKKPFGITMYSTTVSTSVRIATTSVARCRSSTQFSMRP